MSPILPRNKRFLVKVGGGGLLKAINTPRHLLLDFFTAVYRVKCGLSFVGIFFLDNFVNIFFLFFSFIADELVATRKSLEKQFNDISIATSVKISIDNDEIFHIKGISVNRIKYHPLLEAERADTESFRLPTNLAWSTSIDLFKAVFPYEHSFAEAIQNQFLSVVKWLKIIHNLKKKPQDGPLPSDMLITVSF